MTGAELLVALVGAWIFFAANVLSPGPNVFNTMASAMAGGRAAGIGAAAGVALGVSVWAAAALFGAAALFEAAPAAETALLALGAALLAWFGVRFLRRGVRAWRDGVDPRGDGALTAEAAFRQALAIVATNPKALTTWVLMATLFPTADAGVGPIVVLGVGAVLISFTGHVGYALAFSTPPAIRAYARAAWAVFAAVGLFFLSLSAKFALDAVERI